MWLLSGVPYEIQWCLFSCISMRATMARSSPLPIQTRRETSQNLEIRRRASQNGIRRNRSAYRGGCVAHDIQGPLFSSYQNNKPLLGCSGEPRPHQHLLYPPNNHVAESGGSRPVFAAVGWRPIIAGANKCADTRSTPRSHTVQSPSNPKEAPRACYRQLPRGELQAWTISMEEGNYEPPFNGPCAPT